MKISILCSDYNHPVVNYLRKWMMDLSSKEHIVSLVFDRSDLQGGDILFLVSCSQIIRDVERGKYNAILVLHASDLPKGRDWSPHVWSILDGESLITVSLLEAAEPVDSGQIWMKTIFTLEGHELLDEINAKLFEAELYLMTEVVEKFSYIKPTQQVGEPGEYMRKRTSEDSRIDPYKSISDQFNLLRVVDSERYPAFFDYQGMKYLLKIEKVKSE
jgi:methionyl-tRNA formyltransferase